VSDVSGCTQNGLKGRKRVRLWEMGIHQGREERPAGVLCAVDANGCNASMLVEESLVHVRERKLDMSVREIPRRRMADD